MTKCIQSKYYYDRNTSYWPNDKVFTFYDAWGLLIFNFETKKHLQQRKSVEYILFNRWGSFYDK